jgi:hypothetical protein
VIRAKPDRKGSEMLVTGSQVLSGLQDKETLEAVLEKQGE